MERNTRTIIAWNDRMMDTTGLCGAALCEVLAWYADEDDNDSPSDNAVAIAREWEQSPQDVYAAIAKSGRWCLAPTAGCIKFCGKWRAFPANRE